MDKAKSREEITWVERANIISKDNKRAKTLDKLFSNVTKNLDIPEYQTKAIFHENLNTHSTFKLPVVTKTNQVSLSSRNFVKIYYVSIFLTSIEICVSEK